MAHAYYDPCTGYAYAVNDYGHSASTHCPCPNSYSSPLSTCRRQQYRDHHEMSDDSELDSYSQCRSQYASRQPCKNRSYDESRDCRRYRSESPDSCHQSDYRLEGHCGRRYGERSDYTDPTGYGSITAALENYDIGEMCDRAAARHMYEVRREVADRNARSAIPTEQRYEGSMPVPKNKVWAYNPRAKSPPPSIRSRFDEDDEPLPEEYDDVYAAPHEAEAFTRSREAEDYDRPRETREYTSPREADSHSGRAWIARDSRGRAVGWERRKADRYRLW